MQAIKKKHHKPPKTNIPIVFGLTKTELELINKVPRMSLQAFLDNKQTNTDWYNLCFRLRVGCNIAKDVYIEQVYKDLTDILNILINIKEQYLVTNKLTMSVSDINSIEVGLDCIDDIVKETTRRDQLKAFREALIFMTTHTKTTND